MPAPPKPPRRFHVIEGTKPPDSPKERVRVRVRAAGKPPSMLQCHRCAGHELIETKTGVVLKSGKPTGGTKQLICAACFKAGERVVVL